MNTERWIRTAGKLALTTLVFAGGAWVGHRWSAEPQPSKAVSLPPTPVSAPESPAVDPKRSSVQPARPECDPGAAYYDPNYLVLAANLNWTVGPAPQPLRALLFKAFEIPSDIKGAPYPAKEEPTFRFATVDLVEDDAPELLVEYRPNSGTGGRAFVFLTKSGNRWKVISQFLGGFVAMKTPNKFQGLVIYERDGDHYSRVLTRYDAGRRAYVFVSRQEFPQELHDIASGYIDMWNFFWYLAGDRRGCAESELRGKDGTVDGFRPRADGGDGLESVPLRFH